MKLSPKSKPADILALGIKSEIDAAGLYKRLRSRVKNILLRQKLDFLVVEEKHHQAVLESLFHDRFGRRAPKLPASSFLSQAVGSRPDKLSVRELFDAALKAEKDSEDFYQAAAAASADDAGRKMLVYLGRVERSHYFMIKSEIDLLARFPEYYKVEEIELWQDMVHVGP